MSKQSGSGEGHGAPRGLQPPSAPTTPAGNIGSGELDAAALARLTDLDPTGKNRLLERVVDAFTSSSERLLPQLRESAAAGDLQLLRHVVHTLKSSSANVGALRLSMLCATLELQLRQGRPGSLHEASEEIATELSSVEAALHRLPRAVG